MTSTQSTIDARTDVAPSRDYIVSLKDEGITPAEGLSDLLFDPYLLSKSYAKEGDLFSSKVVILCAATACIGGLLFGIDQGLVSIILVMPQFLQVFPSVNTDLSSAAGFNKGSYFFRTLFFLLPLNLLSFLS